MKTYYDSKQHKNIWLLNKWYEKLFYVVGVASLVYYAIVFLIALMAELV